jgi:hypothetical protein
MTELPMYISTIISSFYNDIPSFLNLIWTITWAMSSIYLIASRLYYFFNQKGRQVLKTDALILQQRMTKSLNFVLEHAYEKNWTYQVIC